MEHWAHSPAHWATPCTAVLRTLYREVSILGLTFQAEKKMKLREQTPQPSLLTFKDDWVLFHPPCREQTRCCCYSAQEPAGVVSGTLDRLESKRPTPLPRCPVTPCTTLFSMGLEGLTARSPPCLWCFLPLALPATGPPDRKLVSSPEHLYLLLSPSGTPYPKTWYSIPVSPEVGIVDHMFRESLPVWAQCLISLGRKLCFIPKHFLRPTMI